MGNVEFVHLHNHFQTSLLDGFSTDSEYLIRAVDLGMRGIGQSDHGNLFGTFQFLKLAKQLGITGIPGCEMYVAPINPEGAKIKNPVFYGRNGKKEQYDVSSNGAYLHLTMWAINSIGLNNLFQLSTQSFQQENTYKKNRIDFNMLAEHSEGLIVSTGCPSSEISTRFLLGQDDKAYEYANRLKEVFGDRLFVEIMNHNMSIDIERLLIPKQLELSKKLEIPLLATNDAHYAFESDHVHHEEMLCSQSGSYMSSPTYDEGGNRFAFNGNEYYLKSAEQMAKLFPPEDFPGALSNTLLVAEMAEDLTINFDPDLKPNPKIPEKYSDEATYLKELINIGYMDRYNNATPEVKKEAKKRIANEYYVLESSGFIGYMLTVYEYLKWARDNYSTKDELGNILAYPTGVGRGCFLPGTKVITDEEEIRIEDLTTSKQDGSAVKVKTHDMSYQNIEKIFTYNVEDEDCIRLTLSNGKIIECTADHLIFKKDVGYTKSADLRINNILLGAKNIHEINKFDDTKNAEEKFNASKNVEHEILTENQYTHNEYIITNIEKFQYTGKVYDLQVANVRNYTVSDVTVHNSVGGSIIAFLLYISELDPIKHDLIFERFLSAGRGAT